MKFGPKDAKRNKVHKNILLVGMELRIRDKYIHLPLMFTDTS